MNMGFDEETDENGKEEEESEEEDSNKDALIGQPKLYKTKKSNISE